jgi:hypothetical protein
MISILRLFNLQKGGADIISFPFIFYGFKTQNIVTADIV